jgi:hypothetical protein
MKSRSKYIDASSMLNMYDNLKIAVRVNYEVISLMSEPDPDCVEAFNKCKECFNIIVQIQGCALEHPLEDTFNETAITLDHINVRKLSSEYSMIIIELIKVCESKGVAQKILQNLNKTKEPMGVDQDFIAEQEIIVLREHHTHVITYNRLVDNSTKAFYKKFSRHLPKIICANEIRKRVTFM